MSINKEIQQLNKKINWIAYYQIMGGIIGAVFMFEILLNQIMEIGIKSLVFMIPVAFFSFSVFSGYALLKRLSFGIKLTKINQVIQIPQISILGITYQYYAGLFLGAGLSGLFNIGLNFSISEFKFLFDNSSDEFMAMVNIVPIVILNRLNYYLTELEVNYDKLKMVKKVTIENRENMNDNKS